MSVTYTVKDPWERFIYRFAEMIKDGVEMKISYDGTEAGVSLDSKALGKLSTLFESGVPLEVALGIDLPRMLSSLEGEQLDITLKTKESKLHVRLTGEVLAEFRIAMQQNPLDSETLQMLSKFLKRLTA
ncbi:MAG: hypothetical protein ACE5HJ_06070 [Thermoplasmata archaeon]